MSLPGWLNAMTDLAILPLWVALPTTSGSGVMCLCLELCQTTVASLQGLRRQSLSAWLGQVFYSSVTDFTISSIYWSSFSSFVFWCHKASHQLFGMRYALCIIWHSLHPVNAVRMCVKLCGTFVVSCRFVLCWSLWKTVQFLLLTKVLFVANTA